MATSLAVRQHGGIQIRSLDDMIRWAEGVKASGLAPDTLRTREQIIVATQYGMELGLSPMVALNSIYVIKGKPTIWGDAALALVKSSSVYRSVKETIEGDGDEMLARVVSERSDTGEIVDTTFSVQDAITAGLWNKVGTWKTHPKRMLKYKARAFNLRDNFPDVLGGLHLTEEMYGETVGEPVCETPKRGDRKQVENEAEAPHITDTATLMAMAAGCRNTFADVIGIADEAEKRRLFTHFASLVLMCSHEDVSADDDFTFEMLTAINDMLTNGIPQHILDELGIGGE